MKRNIGVVDGVIWVIQAAVFALLIWALWVAFKPTPANAELTANVSPGYTFSSGERADTSKLNRLGLPTITITGTLDGTNAGISAGSINANMFSSTVVDNLSLDFTNSSPQALRIKSAGVKVREISSDIAGDGLAGGSGSALSVNVDDAAIGITNDVLTLKTNLNPNYLGVPDGYVVIGTSTNRGVAAPLSVLAAMLATNSSASFVHGPVAVGDLSTAHGLGTTPSFVRWVLRCVTADSGYAEGDEVDVSSVCTFDAGNADQYPMFSPGGNSTNVFIGYHGGPGQMPHKTSQSIASFVAGNWRLKCYARP